MIINWNRNFLLLVCDFFLLAPGVCYGQHPVKNFEPLAFDSAYYSPFGNKKIIPVEISQQALTALSFFSELQGTEIEFRFEPRMIPLTTKPALKTILKNKKKRKFIITISNHTSAKLSPILFSNLPYNAQIGVLGHELCHVADFSDKNLFQLMRIAFGHLSGRYLDKMEYATDSSCIDHVLGFQLLSWSEYVRQALKTEKYYGATNSGNYHHGNSKRERYMNPTTIMQILKQHELYKIFFQIP